MHNPAPVDHPVHELIQRRWSPRVFSDRPVEAATLLTVLEAARWAPSSYNEQPWSLIVATREAPEDFERLLACLTPGNQSWARHAPVLMLSVAKLAFARTGKPNRHALHDVGLASAQLALQATALGLAVHFMAGFDGALARQAFAIPDGFEPGAAAALGYHAKIDDLPDEARQKALAPRRRKPLQEFVFSRTWGEPAALLS